jgi:two-component system, chemotaxis family, response regulator Rcp1
VKRVPQLLVVDDNPADIVLAREALSRSPYPCQVHSVMDGEEAIAFLRREGAYVEANRPDLVILDLNLPRKDGPTVLAEIKGDPDLRHLPVVVFTTSRWSGDIARSYAAGANCYVSKPLNLKDYCSAVQGIERFWFGFANLPREEES